MKHFIQIFAWAACLNHQGILQQAQTCCTWNLAHSSPPKEQTRIQTYNLSAVLNPELQPLSYATICWSDHTYCQGCWATCWTIHQGHRPPALAPAAGRCGDTRRKRSPGESGTTPGTAAHLAGAADKTETVEKKMRISCNHTTYSADCPNTYSCLGGE